MKTITRVRPLLFLFILASLAINALAVSTADANTILFIKQEEKLARDVYLTLNAIWGHTTLESIASSEQRHMDAVDTLILRYGLADPTPADIGRFTYPELTELYDTLIRSGSETLENALLAGVLIEETDIEDLSSALAATAQKPIIRVFTNLLEGSQNHLDAFLRALGE